MLVQNQPDFLNVPYKIIELQKGFVCKLDPDDYEKLKKYHWYACKSFHCFYVLTTFRRNGRKVFVRMHRHIMHCKTGLVVHHINHNTMDNRRKNLMILTEEEHIQYFSKR